MKKIFVLLVINLICLTAVNAQTRCSKCRGGGKIQTRWNVGIGSTMNTEKMECPYCHRIIFKYNDHWDDCDRCGGTGKIGSSNTGKSRNDFNGGIIQYLDPQDIEPYEWLLKTRMKGTKQAQVRCSRCNGLRVCQACKGAGMIFGTQPCPGCNMTGRCGGCNGSGVVYQEVPLSQQELQAIDQRIKEYNQKAFSRMK